MTKLLPVALFLPLLVRCASADPSVVVRAPARPDTFSCAKGLLEELGYDLRDVDTSVRSLQAEIREYNLGIGATREIIAISIAPSREAADLLLTVRAFQYRAAHHNLPINRQVVSEVAPSEPVVEDARRVLGSCAGVPPELRFGG